jgi:hypothetical protein
MNKLGASPSLTWVTISIVLGLGVMVLAHTAYSNFLADNTIAMNPTYASHYNNISAENQEFSSLVNETANRDISIWESAAGIVNVFVVGVGAIKSFLTLSTNIKGILNTISAAMPGFTILIGILVTIIGLFITMAIIKGLRGTNDLP